MKISEVAKNVEPSFTRKLFNMAAQYDDVIDFTLGDPDFITPGHIRKAACDAINSGKTRYSANAGLVALRQEISKLIERESGIYYNPDNEIIVTVGAMEGLYLSLLCLIDEGDEVIIPAPYWINYKHMVQMCHGKPVIIESSDENDFIVDVDEIINAITPKTKAIMINSPNNPSGTVYDENTVKRLCDVAKEKDIVIYWDECYKSIVFDGVKITSVLDFPDMKEHAVIVNSFSKKYSMTGWRIGYVSAPAEHIAAMTRLQENIVACAPLPSQYAAIEALKNAEESDNIIRDNFSKRRKVLLEEIAGVPLIKCKNSKGTFYAFINIKDTGMDSVDFAYKLLEKKHVAVVPGVTYGKCCEGYIRIAYTINEDKIREGIRRLKEFTEGLAK